MQPETVGQHLCCLSLEENSRSGFFSRQSGWLTGLVWLWLVGFGWVKPALGEDLSFRIRVALPINSTVEKNVQLDLRALKDRMAAMSEGTVTVVMEFDTSDNVTGEGSSFESSLALARALQDPELRGVRKIGYIPEPAGFSAAAARSLKVKPISKLAGHALLLWLACDELWMHQSAELGGVGKVEDVELLTPNYQTISKRGSQLPSAMVAALVENDGGLYRVTKSDGAKVLVGATERQQLNQDNQEVASDELLVPGLAVELSAGTLSSWGVIQQPVINRQDLLNRLPGKQMVNLSIANHDQPWKASHLTVNHLDHGFVTWASRGIYSEVLVDETNVVFLSIDTLGAADFKAASSFVDTLLDLERDRVRLVALLPQGSSGPETLVALACDEIVIARDQQFGGRQSLPVSDDPMLERLEDQTKRIAEVTGRDWSLVAGLALGNQTLADYRNRQTGGVRLISEQQWKDLPDQQDWQKQQVVPLGNGLTAAEAMQRGVVNHVVDDVQSVKDLYQIDTWNEVVPTATDRGIRRFADFLTNPLVSFLLLFVGIFALSSEFSAPGLGVPGFVSACCLGLFFWAQFMDGNADILEILLFLLGLAFVLLEVFVIPGFGLFGIGGGVMILVSIVLASQKFIIPQSAADVTQLSYSVLTLSGAMVGVFASIAVMRYYMEEIPLFKRMVLEPPVSSSVAELEGEETGDTYGHLLNRTGVAMTTLRPSGKAKFGNVIVDVITDGRMVDRDTTVSVYEVTGTVVKVEPKEV